MVGRPGVKLSSANFAVWTRPRIKLSGTVNDLAMSGARPLYLSVGFIIEVGDHGTTIMPARGELELKTEIQSDAAPLSSLVQAMLAV